MIAKLKLSSKGLELNISVAKWLVWQYGTYSVGQLENGHLIIVAAECEGDEADLFEIYEFDDFDALRAGDACSVTAPLPNPLLRVVAHVLGITHVEKFGKTYDVESCFSDHDEDEEEFSKYYQPQTTEPAEGHLLIQ